MTAPQTDPSRHWQVRRIFPALIREPLVHFLVVGLLLFTSGRAYQRSHDIYRIEITPERVAQLSEVYRRQYGELPGPEMRAVLIQTDIDNEMLFREGIALKLDQDDEIVRRRIIQKMQFLSDDATAPAEPTAAEVAAYYRQHAARYAESPSASFTHVFFAGDTGGKARADRVLPIMADRARAPELGDPFPDLYDFARFGPDQVERLFGDTAFSTAVFTAPLGQWSGPFQSGYGWHLLKVTARTAPAPLPLEKVADRVRADLLGDLQRQLNQAGADARKRRFTIIRSDGAR